MSKARDIADLNVTILDSVESGATADQTNAEIRAAVEAATDSNVFTDADHTKLNSTVATVAGTETLTNKTLTAPDINTPDIDGGTIDGTTVGASSASTGAFTTLSATGVLTANAGVVVDNFTLDGTTLALSSGDMLVDVAGNITLDADDAGEIRLKDGGSQYGALKADSSRFKIQSIISDADMLFAGNDNGSEITALTLDMSAAGAATFSGSVSIAGGIGELSAPSANDLAIYGTASGHTGIRFHDVGILPTNNAGAITDADCDIGIGSHRFKDLYLSGGVVFGPASASNVSSQTLDSYEEGSFTCSLAGTTGQPSPVLTTTGSYTKIGKIVNFTFAFENINTTGYSGHISFQGLPFTSSSTVTARTPVNVLTYLGATIDTNAKSVKGNITSGGSTVIFLYSDRSNDAYGTVVHNARNTVYFWGSGTYQTDQ
jgi:hypothetical protein